MAQFCHPEFGCDCNEGITFTSEQGREVLAMLKSFFGPRMPCDDTGCGYPMCNFMRTLQKARA